LQAKGCKETEISFDNPIDAAAAAAQAWTESYANANAPADHSCDIFHPNGGAVIYKDVPKEWINSTDPELQRFFYTSSDILENVGTDCNDESCAELNINLWSITPNLCSAINEKLGYAALNAALPTASLFGCPFDGDFKCSGGGVQQTFSDPKLKGKLMVCYNDTYYGPTFNAVLQAR
jgi:hypothetical protein